MRILICSQEGCKSKATARCRCGDPEVLFCVDHLGNHLINDPGKHDYEKLLEDPYLQTKKDVLSYIQNEIQNLDNLKTSLTKEVYTGICKIKNSLDVYIGKIDEKIVTFERNLDEIIQALENSNDNTNLEYLKLPSSEAIAYFKENKKDLIVDFTCESIIPEIYKSLGWVKLSEYQEILKKNKELELELLEAEINMNELSEKNRKENEELRQSYEELKAKESEQTKEIASYELTNKQLKIQYDELYKEKRDLELRYNQLIENERQNQNLFQAVPSFTQLNIFKNAFVSKSKVPTINKQFFDCVICKGKFSIAKSLKSDCGCLYCENCQFPEFEKIHGFKNNRRCRICNKKKTYGFDIWS